MDRQITESFYSDPKYPLYLSRNHLNFLSQGGKRRRSHLKKIRKNFVNKTHMHQTVQKKLKLVHK